jgi:hypothetical protein
MNFTSKFWVEVGPNKCRHLFSHLTTQRLRSRKVNYLYCTINQKLPSCFTYQGWWFLLPHVH